MKRPNFRDRMQERLETWYRKISQDLTPEELNRQRFIASLVNKSVMHEFISNLGIPLPKRFYEVEKVEEIDFPSLPDRIVIKPNNSADSDCVMIFINNIDILAGMVVDKRVVANYVENKFQNGRFINKNTRIIVEEFIQDYDCSFKIPRDFKVYVAGGRSHFIQVINRNGPKDMWSHRFYNLDWEPYSDIIQKTYKTDEIINKPPFLIELVRQADLIASKINCFYRLDFYLSMDGPVFGEFTSYPFGGYHFTHYGDQLMCDLMDTYPDKFER